MTTKISLIAAVAENRVIGADQSIPWRIPSDFGWFKSQTMGKPMVMGRKQFATFRKPLPGRPHIVVTRQEDYTTEGVIVRHSLDKALEVGRTLALEAGVDEVMVIGGGDIYAQAMVHADRLYITHVALQPEGDVLFPFIDPSEWKVVSSPDWERLPTDEADYHINIYERVHGPAH